MVQRSAAIASRERPKRSPALAPESRRCLSASERRAQILRAGAQCFGTRGFRGTTTRDIAAAVGRSIDASRRNFHSEQTPPHPDEFTGQPAKVVHPCLIVSTRS